VLTANSATAYNSYGGGACESRLENCLLTANSANSGGGAYRGTLNNCMLTSNSFHPPVAVPKALRSIIARSWLNSAFFGGGAFSCLLNNCTVASNSAGSYAALETYYGTLHNCIDVL